MDEIVLTVEDHADEGPQQPDCLPPMTRRDVHSRTQVLDYLEVALPASMWAGGSPSRSCQSRAQTPMSHILGATQLLDGSDLPSRQNTEFSVSQRTWSADFEKALKFLREEVVGRNRIIEGPLGPRLKVYMDYTASGQSLHFVNHYMQWIRQNFANTHTEDSATGRFMTESLEMAMKSIERCVNAKDKFVALCTGTGSTGAMLRLQQILGIYVPPAAWTKLGIIMDLNSAPLAHERVALKIVPNCSVSGPAPVRGECPDWLHAREKVKGVIRGRGQLPLVIVGGYEHHSNEVSWREGLCDVARIPLTKSFELDLTALEKLLEEHRKMWPSRPIIGSISACSNVTGMRTDIRGVSRLLRKAGALFFVDYAASAPYEQIDCCPDDNENMIDGVFVSPHKFLGGDGACGLLVLRRSVYDQRLPPTMAGGGTVKAVSKAFQAYVDDIVERENAGTPGALQIYQCALAFEVKEALGPQRIEEREALLLDDFFKWLKASFSREILVLGNQDPEKRHSIVSFNIVKPIPLHPRFVTVLLSDLFGLQTRAGCSCAGPHGADLFKAPAELERAWLSYIVGTSKGTPEQLDDVGMVSVKPGWCRFNLHYTMDEDDMWYLKEALSFIVNHGASFLRIYSFDAVSGAWCFSPPDALRGAFALHSTEDRHRFGLATAMVGGVSRDLPGNLRRDDVLKAQIRSAFKLLDKIPKTTKIVAPPAPLSGSLPSHGSGPWFMIADGQIHNLEGFEECLKRHREQVERQDMQPVAGVSTNVNGEGAKMKLSASQHMAAPITITWARLSVTSTAKGRCGAAQILRSCSGAVAPGERLCVFGPAGAGKSTLLKVLGGRHQSGVRLQVAGRVMANGVALENGVRFSSFVSHDSILQGSLTVYETLKRSAELLLPYSAASWQKDVVVRELLESMALSDWAGSRVGPNLFTAALPNPQQRRLAVAVEFLRGLSVLLLDEPTRGMDKHEADLFMRQVSLTAARSRTSLVIAMNEASSECWALFDKVCLLTRGRVAFFGDREGVLPYCEMQGFMCPSHSRPTDFFLQLLTREATSSNNTAELLCDRFVASDEGRAYAAASQASSGVAEVATARGSHRAGQGKPFFGGVTQCFVLTRTLVFQSRQEAGLIRLVICQIISIMMSAICWELDGKHHYPAVQGRIVLCFFIPSFVALVTLATLPQRIQDRAVFAQDHANGHYRVWAYTVASVLAALPEFALTAALSGAAVVPATGLMTFRRYFVLVLLSFVVAEGVVTVAVEISSTCAAATASVLIFQGWCMLVQGFVVTWSSTPVPLRWMCRVAPSSYAFKLAMVATFTDIGVLETDTWSTGGDVLKSYEIFDDEWHISMALLWWAIALHVLGYMAKLLGDMSMSSGLPWTSSSKRQADAIARAQALAVVEDGDIVSV